MRAGSNFNDNEDRMYIGKNGIGAKATNIFSQAFVVECADPETQLLYRQTWQTNMTQRGEPEISQLPSGTPGYTQISYSLDFPRFDVAGFDQESAAIYGAHSAALSYVCQLPVVFNGNTFQVKTLVDYAKMFFQVNKSSAVTYKDPQGSYDLCLIDTPNEGLHVSFVNGMITERGGVNVDAAYRVIVKAIIDYMD
jgi:DNA topoisomerase-2